MANSGIWRIQIVKHKVCFVGTEMTPSEGSTFVGGGVNTVVALSKGLSNLGWEVHIVTSPSRFLRESVHDFPWAKIHVIHTNGAYNSLSNDLDLLLKAVRTIENLSKEESFDIVHGHSGYFGSAIIAALVRRRLGIPAFFSLYCARASLIPTKLPIDNYGVRILSLGLDKIIAVTKNVERSLVKYGVDCRKIEVLPSCFDEEVFNMHAHNLHVNKERPAEDSRIRRVLFVGNVEKTKGLDILLVAAKAVLRTNPEVKFMITLHEPIERLQRVRILASRSLGSSVEVFGVVGNMAKLIDSADVVVVPFRSTEGITDIPIIILEAMALGKPVVASNLDGIKEAIRDGENGFLVNSNNPDEFAKAIINLLNNQDLREEIGNQANLSVARYSNSAISKQLVELYEKTIGDGSQ